jgi:N-methylhydantoinase A/oxoprolinase/acetone carboxylase beta subunit
VTPLAYLAWQFPHIRNRLKTLSRRTWAQTSPEALEYWFLLREPQPEGSLKSEREKNLVDLLRHGPLPVPDILKQLNLLHVAQIGAEALLRREIVGKAGLTPTDLIHVTGGYTPWDVEAASLALEAFSRHKFNKPADIQRYVWSQTTELIVAAIVAFLTGIERPSLSNFHPPNDLGAWFFHNSIYATHAQLETSFRLRYPIIGIGAPAGIFLKEVAAVLHTDLILPEHHQVANAVGAIAGSVMVTEEILIYPRMSSEGLDVISYYVQASNERQEFEELEYALAFARTLGQDRAMGAAIRSGAGNPQVVVEELADGLDTYRIRAKAVGNPRLAK